MNTRANYYNLFASKTHTHSPDELGVWNKHCGSVSDFNNALSEGGYHVASQTSITNAPYTGDIYGKLIVYVSTGDTHNDINNWIWQTFYDTSGNIYRRYKVNSLPWNPWQWNPYKENKTGSWWNEGAVYVKSDGVCEIGKYLDFHTVGNSYDDYNIRLESRGDGLFLSSSLSPYGKQSLGASSYRWLNCFLTYSPNVSSDRNLKKDIKYLCHKDVDHELNYNDMYAFVRDELELAEYKFKESEDKKVGFIAQDLLYDNNYNDSKVGQFIVPPVAPHTDEEKAEIIANLSEGEEYKEPTLSYDMGNYTNVLAGALKTAINEIEVLKQEINELKQSSGLL